MDEQTDCRCLIINDKINRQRRNASMKQSSQTSLVPASALVRQFQAVPPGKLFCLHGNSGAVFRMSLSMASHALLQGVPIAVVDGSNRFDAYRIASVARQVTSQHLAKRCVAPEELLNNIFIARAFTCYQMEATITERLPTFVQRIGAPVAMIFGLLDTFYDEQAPLFEVRASLERIVAALHRLKQENISVLLSSVEMKLESRERNGLLPRVKREMDQVYWLEESKEGHRIVLIGDRYEPRRR